MRFGRLSFHNLVGCTLIMGYLLFVMHLVWAWKAEATPVQPLHRPAPVITTPPSDSAPTDEAITMLQALNQQRTAEHLPLLSIDGRLSKIAHQRVNDMTARQYYAHQSPDGRYYTDLLAQDGLAPVHSCENLDLTSYTDEQLILRDWLTSIRGHRQCLLHAQDNRIGYATGVFTVLDSNKRPQPVYITAVIISSDL